MQDTREVVFLLPSQAVLLKTTNKIDAAGKQRYFVLSSPK
jgi:hypothetical protein